MSACSLHERICSGVPWFCSNVGCKRSDCVQGEQGSVHHVLDRAPRARRQAFRPAVCVQSLHVVLCVLAVIVRAQRPVNRGQQVLVVDGFFQEIHRAHFGAIVPAEFRYRRMVIPLHRYCPGVAKSGLGAGGVCRIVAVGGSDSIKGMRSLIFACA